MRHPSAPAHEGGFSLIEVMVALIIICVGLLGIAKLEAVVLSSAGTSRVRALIALQADSLADTMHADRDFWDGGSSFWTVSAGNPLSVTATSSAGSPTLTSANASLQSAMATGLADAQATSPSDPCLDTACTSVALAGDDLAQWAVNLAGVVQNSSSTIDCSAVVTLTTITTCTITIQWSENTVAANSQEVAAGAPTTFQQQTYTLVVEP